MAGRKHLGNYPVVSIVSDHLNDGDGFGGGGVIVSGRRAR